MKLRAGASGGILRQQIVCPGLLSMKRKIAAIFAADIAGYSMLVAEDEEETLRRLASYRSVTDDFIAKSGGRIFNTTATRFLPSFQVRSKRCAAPSTSRKACAPGTWRIRPAVR
jgi:class 3 adenylate cyclase